MVFADGIYARTGQSALLPGRKGLSVLVLLIRGLLLAMLTASLLLSQNVYGTFTGVVTDGSGAVMPNVTVTAGRCV